MNQGWFVKKIFKGITGLMLVTMISACNVFDNKIQGQIGDDVAGPDKPNQATRVGIAAEFPEYVFGEGTTQSLKFILTSAAKAPATFNWRIVDGAGDFTVDSGTVSVLEKADSFKLDLTAITDTVYEGEEQFNLIVEVDSTLYASNVTVPLKITERAAVPPQVSFQESARTVNESAGSYNIQVRLSQASGSLIRVRLEASGTATVNSDYSTSPSEDLVFAPGETAKNITINVINDSVLSEGIEDLSIQLSEIVVGTARIDNANKTFTLLIEDDDNGPSPITIQGVAGSSDVTTNDFYLTAGQTPTIYWDAPALSNETGFDINIFEMNGVTVKCTIPTVGANFTSAVMTGCLLTEGQSYKISVVANIIDGTTLAAGNNMVTFKVDTLPPTAFSFLGVMGGNDIIPDSFLAGALQPTLVWKDSDGESYYEIEVFLGNGTAIGPQCRATNVPANVTSYNFESCNLVAEQSYKARVIAFDATGLQTKTSPEFYDFTVTSNTSGYLILGVKGGVADTTADANMDDGAEPIIRWQKAFEATGYEVSITDTLGNPVPGCPTKILPDGSVAETTMSGCDLNLHDEYFVRVLAHTSSGSAYAANSPFRFRHRVGLYISGTGGSYINGVSIKTCSGAGDVCSAPNGYVSTSLVKYDKIRISNNGVLSGSEWTGNNPTVGNGVVKIEATTLRLDTGGTIQMDGKGYTATQGPGAGSSGPHGNGASHGGLGGITTGGTQGPAYGDALNPIQLGSGGGNGSFPSNNLGGAGGGAIDITVTNLILNSGTITANGNQGQTGNGMTSRNGGGGGSGGSVKIVTESFTGATSVIRVNGAGGPSAAISSAGAGGRIAFYYKTNTYGSFSNLLQAYGGRTTLTNFALTSSAAGTVFYKNTSTVGGDAYGHLLINNNNVNRAQGVETPIPLTQFDTITTLNRGTLIIPSIDTYNHPNNIIDFDLVVAGGLTLGGSPNDLVIGTISKTSTFEWRRLDKMIFDSITIQRGSVLTHPRNDSSANYRLNIETTNLDIYGKIDVTGKGYSMGNGPGKPTGRFGASHGGLGGLNYSSNSASSRSQVYGSIKNPTLLGSGGTAYSNPTSSLAGGGGSVQIKTTQLRLVGERLAATKTAALGEIRADGDSGQVSGAAGGSILIEVDRFIGLNGTVSADGGSGVYAAGSGGRISILYKKDDRSGSVAPESIFSELSTGIVELTSKGGVGNKDGAAGTIYLRKTDLDALDPMDSEPIDPNGRLWVFNGTRGYDEPTTTVLAEAATLFDAIRTDTSGTLHVPAGASVTLPSNNINFRLVAEGDFVPTNNLTIKPTGYLEWRKISPLNVSGTFSVEAGGVLTHSKNDLTRQYVLNVQATDVVIAGTVNAKGKGYGVMSGPGAPPPSQYYAWGAAHAGLGRDSNAVPQGSGTPYSLESVLLPIELGSGAGCSGGGGAISIIADDSITLSGTIDASSYNATSACSTLYGGTGFGGGSGGSIYLKADRLISTKVVGTSPIINVNGGAGGFTGSGTGYSGSAGRIAIDIPDDQMTGGGLRQAVIDKNLMAIGGLNSSIYSASAGTIYLKTGIAAASRKYLYLNNDNLPYYDRVETPIPNDVFDETYTLGNATLAVTEGQIFTLNPSNLRARLAVAGIFSANNNEIIIENGGYLQWRRTTPIKVNNLVIKNGGVLTHTSNFVDAQYRLEVETDTLDLQAGGKIDASEKGYQPVAGPGGASSGGGAYGGNTRTRFAYGSVEQPTDLGSGGQGSAGGGSIQLRVKDSLTIAGEILADGKAGAGAGAGGSVQINADSSGIGAVGVLKFVTGYKISAKGGLGSANESGSGGRIAIYYDNYDNTGGVTNVADAANSNSIIAFGGAGTDQYYGAAGTIFYKQVAAPQGTMVIKNNGITEGSELVSTPIPDGTTYPIITQEGTTLEIRQGESAHLPTDLNYRLILGGSVVTPGNDLVIKNKGILEIRRGTIVSDFDSIVIENGGVLTHTSNTNAKNYWAELQTTDFEIQAGGKINVDGKGYSAGSGLSPGCAPFTDMLAGGTHAGFGNNANLNCVRAAYGSVKKPTDFGSAGGTHQDSGTNWSGAGGGFVKITSTNLVLNGDISALGMEGRCESASRCGGSGAGGSVYLDVANLSGGSGNISVNGGFKNLQSTEMAAGGGGRISVNVSTSGTIADARLSARGGLSSLTKYPAGAGTIFKKLPGATNGTLLITNYDTPYSEGTYTELFTSEAFDSVSVGTSTTSVGVRKGTSFNFGFSNLTFPLVRAGKANFSGYGVADEGNVNINNGGILIISGTEKVFYKDVNINNGGILTHTANRSSLANAINLEADNFSINNGGRVDVTGRGYAAASGLGKGLNGTFSGLSGGGGSFGGAGGGTGSAAAAGSTYGLSNMSTVFIGSGGGNGENGCLGGSGGGGVYLKINSVFTLEQTGQILANGSSATNAMSYNPAANCRSGGAGSGGAIRIETADIATDVYVLTQRLQARGGHILSDPTDDGFEDGGAGGGGRIYVNYQNSSLTDLQIADWSDASGGVAEAGASMSLTGSAGSAVVIDSVP